MAAATKKTTASTSAKEAAKALAKAETPVEKKTAPAKAEEKTETKAPAKKAPAKKAPAKKTTTAKKEVVKTAAIEDNYGHSKTQDEIIDAAIANFKEEHKRVAVESIDVYIKPSDNKVYYVVNGKEQGNIDLF